MRHVDAHVHVYPDALMQAIYRYFLKLGWQLPVMPDASQVLSHLKKVNAEKAFLLLYSHKPGMSFQLNRWVYELCRENPDLYPFGCYFPGDDKNEEMVRTCLQEWNFSGMKVQFHVQNSHPDDPGYEPLYRVAAELGKGIFMHVGKFPFAADNTGADRLGSVMKKFPELKVVVAHLGFYQTEDYWFLMDRYPDIYLDTSFILGNPAFTGAESLVHETLKRFPDRVLYGSDFPLLLYRLEDGLHHIASLPWDEKLKEKLMYENALRFLTT